MVENDKPDSAAAAHPTAAAAPDSAAAAPQAIVPVGAPPGIRALTPHPMGIGPKTLAPAAEMAKLKADTGKVE